MATGGVAQHKFGRLRGLDLGTPVSRARRIQHLQRSAFWLVLPALCLSRELARPPCGSATAPVRLNDFGIRDGRPIGRLMRPFRTEVNDLDFEELVAQAAD